MYCTMSMHVKEHQMAEISGALHYGVPHNHIMILARKIPDIIIKRQSRWHSCSKAPYISSYHNSALFNYWLLPPSMNFVERATQREIIWLHRIAKQYDEEE